MSDFSFYSDADSLGVAGDLVILPNFKIPEPEKSEVLKALVDEISWPINVNFNRTYSLKEGDGQERNVTVGYIFDPALGIPDHLLLSLQSYQKFFGMLPPSVDRPIVALVSLVPFESVADVSFHRKTTEDAFVAENLLDLEFIVMDVRDFSVMLNSWHLTNQNPGMEQSEVWIREREPHEKLIFLERNRGLYTTNYCEEYFRLKLCEEGLLPKETQHLAFRNQSLIYATPRVVAATRFEAKLYKRSAKSTVGFWPPQLRRYGRSIYWSRYNGKELMRWRDSEGDNHREATPVCDLREHDLTVRRIATSDATEEDHLTIVASSGNKWKILFFADVNTGKFVDLECPLRAIDSVAVMDNVVYALGNYSDCLFPNVVLFYKNGKWSERIQRIETVLPTAFFPLNGRLYIFANGLASIEVFNPETNRWTTSSVAQEMNDICGFTLLSTPARFQNEL